MSRLLGVMKAAERRLASAHLSGDGTSASKPIFMLLSKRFCFEMSLEYPDQVLVRRRPRRGCCCLPMRFRACRNLRECFMTGPNSEDANDTQAAIARSRSDRRSAVTKSRDKVGRPATLISSKPTSRDSCFLEVRMRSSLGRFVGPAPLSRIGTSNGKGTQWRSGEEDGGTITT